MISAKSKKVFVFIALIPFVLMSTSTTHQDNPKDNPRPDVQKELEAFKIADGFEVTLFASEPLVAKPIQMNWDEDGRLWVVSSTAYPHVKTGETANDKIFVLEDTDGDGKADKSTVFAEGLITPTGILPGDGGVYVANSTEILHFKDTDGDGKADQKRQILTGFGVADTHHLIHTFRWGPEGRLYFNQSIYIYSHVETPTGIKRLEGGGVWQLDPKTLDLNIYAKGLINPWGLRFDQWGQSFLTDGAGYEGINYAFPGATFVTAPGAERIIRGLNPGQPKHSGLDIISSRHLPESWQNSLITNDFRANRINRFVLEAQGSGYASRQVEDVLWTDHVAFRPVDISVGPDGAMYVADWYNPIIQHGEVDFNDPRRDQERGRIWRITAKNRPLVKVPKLSQASTTELLDMLKLPEDWTRSQAKQVLKNRGAGAVIPALKTWLDQLDKNSSDYERLRLESLWVHQSLDVVNEPLLLDLLNAKQHQARAAALRALQLWNTKIANVPALLTKAVQDEHPQVRLEAVIALRKIKTAEAARTALTVLENPMDEFLDFALWQTTRELEPLWAKKMNTEPNFLGSSQKTAYALKSSQSPKAIAQLITMYQQGQVPSEYLPDVFNSLARYGTSSDLTILLEQVLVNPNTKQLAAQLNALEAAAIERKVKPTLDLGRIERFFTNEDPGIATTAIRLTGYWGLTDKTEQLIEIAKKGDSGRRKATLTALATVDKKAAPGILSKLADQTQPTELRMMAVNQLATLDQSAAARQAVDLLKTLPTDTDVSELFQTFLAGKSGINALAAEISARKIPEYRAGEGLQFVKEKVSMYFVKKNQEDIDNFNRTLEASGGKLRVENMKQLLNDEEIASLTKTITATADAANGERIYRQSSCETCHAIGGAGGLLGPDLSSLGTSSPVPTIIRSVLYPTASIKEGYELQRVAKKDGNELMGYLVSNGLAEVQLRDVSGTEVTIPKTQIQSMGKVPGSLMPAGLTASLSQNEFNDLIGFLSRLGASGDYRVPTARYVRRWEVLPAQAELVNATATASGTVVKATAKAYYQPLYSRVSGDLPLADLPQVTFQDKKQYSIVRFEVEVLTPGKLSFAINATQGLSAWAGQKSLKITNSGAVADLGRGTQQITLAVDRTLFTESVLRIQLLDGEASTAQTRLPVGR